MAVDDDINIRDWKDVIWAITTRVDPTRDTLLASGAVKPAANGAAKLMPDLATGQ